MFSDYTSNGISCRGIDSILQDIMEYYRVYFVMHTFYTDFILSPSAFCIGNNFTA